MAIIILKKASSQEFTIGRGPTGMATAAIDIASVLCGEHRTQIEDAEIAGVTEVTIRNRYKEIAYKLDIEFLTKEKALNRAMKNYISGLSCMIIKK